MDAIRLSLLMFVIAVCAANEITNNFVDMMVQRVMELPERDV